MSVLNRLPALRRLSAASLSLPALVCVASAPVWAQVAAPRAVNVVNTKFATITNGTQAAIHVAVPANASSAEINDAVIKRLKATWNAQSRAMSRSVKEMQKAGILKNGPIPISTVVQVEQNGKPLTRAQRTRSVGNGTLTFRYEDWSDQDRVAIQRYIALLTPRIEAIYGKPAVSEEVLIKNAGSFDSSTIPDVQRIFAYGGYMPATDKTPATIMLPIFRTNEQFVQALLLNLLHAYHGPAVFRYDAWEQGFARAAAAVISRTTDEQGNNLFSDPASSNYFSLLAYYDLLNQPGLGNSTFFPPSQAKINLEETAGGFTFGKMMFPRVGMSGAAWLKVYIQNPDFFRQFNEEYYRQFDIETNTAIAGNVPALKSIAATLLPNGVEGDAFNQWYSKQYVLDTSISLGRKLYAYVAPGLVEQDGGQSHLIQIVHYKTKADGDEELINGRVYATYHDASGSVINLGVASEQVDLVDGEGSITTQSFQKEEGRITMDFAVETETARAYVPSGFSGDFQGLILGSLTSKSNISNIQIQQVTSQATRNQTTQSKAGAFTTTFGAGVYDLARTIITYTDATGAQKTFYKNTGDGQAYVILTPDQDSGAVRTVTKTFTRATTPYFVTFPVQPQVANVPSALNLGINDFVLSYWDPVTTNYLSVSGDPNTSALGSIAPGRGYWFKVQPEDRAVDNVTVSVTGVAPVTDTDFAIPGRYGWNMIGSPFTGDKTDVSDILVQYLQTSPITWDAAVKQNIVAATPYRFDRNNGTFVEADTINAVDWEPLYFRVLVPGSVTFILPAPDAAGRSVVLRKGRSVSTTTPRPDWAVTLRASQAPDDQNSLFGRTATATLGVAKSASDKFDNLYDREQPPSIINGVGLSFDASKQGSSAGGRYVADFRGTTSRKAEWAFTSSALASGPVRLEWGNVGTVPRNTSLTLTDTETGEKIALRSRSSYVWQATETKRTRKFTITTDAARTTPLLLSNIVVARTTGRAQSGSGGRSYNISYSVTGDANVSVEMTALNGKVVRRLSSSGRAAAGGRQSIVWDGRAENGATLPAGGYTLRITATPTDGSGTSVTVLRPVMVLN